MKSVISFIVVLLLLNTTNVFAQNKVEIEGQLQIDSLKGAETRFLAVDSGGLLIPLFIESGSNNSSIVLKDSLGNIRFVIDANAGVFEYTPNDSTLLRITSGSPFEIEAENKNDGTTAGITIDLPEGPMVRVSGGDVGLTILGQQLAGQFAFEKQTADGDTTKLRIGVDSLKIKLTASDPPDSCTLELDPANNNVSVPDLEVKGKLKTDSILLGFGGNDVLMGYYGDDILFGVGGNDLRLGFGEDLHIKWKTNPDSTGIKLDADSNKVTVTGNLEVEEDTKLNGLTVMAVPWKMVIDSPSTEPVPELEYKGAGTLFKAIARGVPHTDTVGLGWNTEDRKIDVYGDLETEGKLVVQDSVRLKKDDASWLDFVWENEKVKIVFSNGTFSIELDEDDSKMTVNGDLQLEGGLTTDTIGAGGGGLTFTGTDGVSKWENVGIDNFGDVTVKGNLTVGSSVTAEGSGEFDEELRIRDPASEDGNQWRLHAPPALGHGFLSFTGANTVETLYDLDNQSIQDLAFSRTLAGPDGMLRSSIELDNASQRIHLTAEDLLSGNSTSIHLAPNDSVTNYGGAVHVNGCLTKLGGAFRIDHPLDPYNKYLYHSFVESPEMLNVYSGVVVTDNEGFATVQMPHYFNALNRNYRYQLTTIGKTFARAVVWEEINEKGAFVIRSEEPGLKVSWMVTGVRNDVYAKDNPVKTEQQKVGNDRGKLLYPRK